MTSRGKKLLNLVNGEVVLVNPNKRNKDADRIEETQPINDFMPLLDDPVTFNNLIDDIINNEPANDSEPINNIELAYDCGPCNDSEPTNHFELLNNSETVNDSEINNDPLTATHDEDQDPDYLSPSSSSCTCSSSSAESSS